MVEEAKEFVKELSESIEYGWYDRDDNLREHITKDFTIEYRLKSPEEIKKRGYGICWDVNEVQRDFYEKKKVKFMTVFVVINNILIKHPNHAFVIFEYNDKFYWSEATLKNRKGIHEFDSLEEILDFIRGIFPEIATKPIKEKYMKKIEFFSYERPKYDIKVIDFFIHCIKGNKIG